VCGWQVKLCDPLVTHGPYLSALEIRVGIIKRYTNWSVYFTLLLLNQPSGRKQFYGVYECVRMLMLIAFSLNNVYFICREILLSCMSLLYLRFCVF